PEWRRQLELEDQRRAQRQESQNDDDEYRRPVAAVGKGIAKAARVARLPHLERQGPLEKSPVAASRAPTQKAGAQCGTNGIFVSRKPDARRSAGPCNAGIRHSDRTLQKNGGAACRLPRLPCIGTAVVSAQPAYRRPRRRCRRRGRATR